MHLRVCSGKVGVGVVGGDHFRKWLCIGGFCLL